jgi:phage-related minor tail protein
VFRFAGGGRTGMAGEAGAEAILPLKRDGSGRLGVSAGAFGGGNGGDNHFHTWNIQTPSPESFMRSRNQVEAAMTLSMSKARARNNQ